MTILEAYRVFSELGGNVWDLGVEDKKNANAYLLRMLFLHGYYEDPRENGPTWNYQKFLRHVLSSLVKIEPGHLKKLYNFSAGNRGLYKILLESKATKHIKKNQKMVFKIACKTFDVGLLREYLPKYCGCLKREEARESLLLSLYFNLISVCPKNKKQDLECLETLEVLQTQGFVLSEERLWDAVTSGCLAIVKKFLDFRQVSLDSLKVLRSKYGNIFGELFRDIRNSFDLTAYEKDVSIYSLFFVNPSVRLIEWLSTVEKDWFKVEGRVRNALLTLCLFSKTVKESPRGKIRELSKVIHILTHMENVDLVDQEFLDFVMKGNFLVFLITLLKIPCDLRFDYLCTILKRGENISVNWIIKHYIENSEFEDLVNYSKSKGLDFLQFSSGKSNFNTIVDPKIYCGIEEPYSSPFSRKWGIGSFHYLENPYVLYAGTSRRDEQGNFERDTIAKKNYNGSETMEDGITFSIQGMYIKMEGEHSLTWEDYPPMGEEVQEMEEENLLRSKKRDRSSGLENVKINKKKKM
jgi:hypothetical protein